MTDISVVTREEIARIAEPAARDWALNPHGPEPQCPYPIGSDAAAAWRATFQRFLLLYSSTCGEQEASA
jgi:hypothetical protein